MAVLILKPINEIIGTEYSERKVGVKNALLPKFKKVSRKTLVMRKTNGVPFYPLGRTWMAFLVLN